MAKKEKTDEPSSETENVKNPTEAVEIQPKEETPEVKAEEVLAACIPPVPLSRNEYGLLMNVDHIFDEEGFVDWRKMIDPKFLFAKKDAPDKPIEQQKDADLIIQLGGIKKLARLRGFTSVDHKIIIATPDYVAVETRIHWHPNYETSGREVSFTSLADAHGYNTEGFTKHYLTSIAENRGFVRAVRNFLNINIVGKEELGAKVEESSGEIAANGRSEDILKKLLEINNIPFEAFKNRMLKAGVQAQDWNSLKDIPKNDVLEIIGVTERIIEASSKSK